MTARIAACPNCGAEIVFMWSGAVQTTCPACRSVLVRHDLDLAKVGTVGDVPPTATRLQIGSEGRWGRTPFTVVGRIIYEYQRGHWNEWYVRLGDDTGAWLSDAQGEYALTRQVAPTAPLPGADALRVGQILDLEGTAFEVASITTAHYGGVEGELPFEYWDKSDVPFADLRSDGPRFATIDFSEAEPILFVGESATFEALALRNLRDDAPADGSEANAPTVRGLNCPNCGAAIVLRAGDATLVVACAACGAVLDAKDPNLRVLQMHAERSARQAWKPLIPLGSTGALGGERWQAIGFQVRDITVEGTSYAWREYVLWSPRHGFRYLTEYDGHWNDVTTVQGVPRQTSGGTQPVVEYGGERFRHFQSATATTRLVLGEFPWEVRVGDTARVHDFVAPPRTLSREETAHEATWSLSTYVTPEQVAEAFALKQRLPAPRGVYANQPNPAAAGARAYLRLFALFAVALFALLLVREATARNERVFEGHYRFSQADGDTMPFVTPVFDVKGHTSNVVVTTTTTLDGDWAFFNLALIDTETGHAYDFGREVSYYAGVDDGESWQEGSRDDRVVLPSVPPGRYYLRVGPEREPGGKPFAYTIRLRRDVARPSLFLIGLLVLLVPPAFSLFRSHAFETRRWQESDHAPVSSSSSDDE